MGNFADPSVEAGSTVRTFILGKLTGLRRGSVVSASAVVRDLLEASPDCELPPEQLAKLVSEAAMLLGLIPVIDPAVIARKRRSISALG